jgi:hypothetical protein
MHWLCQGTGRENFPAYLVEYEIRYNHRDEYLLSILVDGF